MRCARGSMSIGGADMAGRHYAHPSGLETVVHMNVASVPDNVWSGLIHPSPYHDRAWLLARSLAVKGEVRYIVVSRPDGTPVLGVPSYFTGPASHQGYDPARLLLLDDLDYRDCSAVPGGIASVARIRSHLEAHPEVLSPSIAISTPGLFGGVSLPPPSLLDALPDAIDAAIDATERQADVDAAATIGWLYVVAGLQPALENRLRQRGYTAVTVGADCYLPLQFDSLASYFHSFRPHRRRTFTKESRLFDDYGVRVQVFESDALNAELAALELQWRHKYGRAATLEDTLANYAALRTEMGSTLKVVVARQADRVVGFVTYLDDGHTWWARFGGFDYTADVPFLYFNLVFYQTIRLAIDRGLKCIAYSRSAYETKRSRGCVFRQFYVYVRLAEDSPLHADLPTIQTIQSRRFARIEAGL